VGVRLRDLERCDADVEPSGFHLLLDESRDDERLEEPEYHRLLEPGLPLHLGEAERLTLFGERAQDAYRSLDRLDVIAPVLFRITVRRSDNAPTLQPHLFAVKAR
jgi:hypothetical protein